MRVFGKAAGLAVVGVVAAMSVPAGSAAAKPSASAAKPSDMVRSAVKMASSGAWFAERAWLVDQDVNSLHHITRSAGAQQAWAAGVTGAGVGVALIDSGVAPVPGLDSPGKVVNGPDLSFESQVPELAHLDTYGHGTHLAGIIAGRGPGVLGAPGTFAGMAPGAHLVSLKVASVDGATDVSQVIAAIDWVVQHRDDPGMNIRVLNLSFGTDSVQSADLDPLSYAVEAAWRHGIVVVVAVGNDGAERTRVSMPAANPYVIAVGAADPHQTETLRDDTIASFSTAGDRSRHADILAAGRSVVSLRNPGSYVDTLFPEGRVPGTDNLFRGSGTSQSAAVVSGAAALLLQQRPDLTPDQVKLVLAQSAQAMPGSAKDQWGAGQLDLTRALAQTPSRYRQSHRAATGLGTLEGARGSAHVADPDTAVELTGEQDIFGRPWRPETWAPRAGSGSAWDSGRWNGSDWTGAAWAGTSWAARTWSGRTWSGRTWSGRTWSGVFWHGRTWSGRTWSGRTWSGGAWA